MAVCGEMILKLVEPLVSIPASNGLTPSPSNNALSAMSDVGSNNSLSTSPTPFPENVNGRDSSLSVLGTKKLPLTADGKLCIPQPWTNKLHENKMLWKGRAAVELKERERKAAEEEKRRKEQKENQDTQL